MTDLNIVMRKWQNHLMDKLPAWTTPYDLHYCAFSLFAFWNLSFDFAACFWTAFSSYRLKKDKTFLVNATYCLPQRCLMRSCSEDVDKPCVWRTQISMTPYYVQWASTIFLADLFLSLTICFVMFYGQELHDLLLSASKSSMSSNKSYGKSVPVCVEVRIILF